MSCLNSAKMFGNAACLSPCACLQEEGLQQSQLLDKEFTHLLSAAAHVPGYAVESERSCCKQFPVTLTMCWLPPAAGSPVLGLQTATVAWILGKASQACSTDSFLLL